MSERRVFHIRAGDRKLIPVKSGTAVVNCLAGVCTINNRELTVSRLLKPGSRLQLKSQAVYVVRAKTDMLLNVCG